MMVTTASAEMFCNKLREFIGTPFQWAGRVKGPQGGVDCCGLVLCALQELGWTFPEKDILDARGDHTKVIQRYLVTYCDRVYWESDGLEPGDVILIRDDNTILHHLVVFTDRQTIIHAWRTTGVNKVVETEMLPDWWKHIHSVWKIRGIV